MMKSLLAGLFLLAAVGASAWDKSQEAEILKVFGSEMLSYRSEPKTTALQALKPTLPPQQAELRKAILFHNLSLLLSPKGVTGNAAQAVTVLKRLAQDQHQAEVSASVIQCYLGSALGLQAQEDWNPFAKVGGVNDAFAVLDGQVGKYGKVYFLPRFFRAQVARAVPDFFNKKVQYQEDLEEIERLARTDASYVVPPEVLSDVYDQLGNLSKEHGKVAEAVARWKKAVALDPEGQFGGKNAAKSLSIFED